MPSGSNGSRVRRPPGRRGPANDGQAAAVSPRPASAPAGKINVTDPDSQLVKSLHGWVQGYTAQAAATPEQIVVAADVITSGNERNRLEPMVDQALHELAAAGVDETPRGGARRCRVLQPRADIHRLRQRGLRPLVSPDASGRSEPGLTRRKPAYQQMREELVSDDGYELYRRRAQNHRGGVREHQDPASHRPLPTPADYAPVAPSGV